MHSGHPVPHQVLLLGIFDRKHGWHTGKSSGANLNIKLSKCDMPCTEAQVLGSIGVEVEVTWFSLLMIPFKIVFKSSWRFLKHVKVNLKIVVPGGVQHPSFCQFLCYKYS